MASNHVIGSDGVIPWDIPEDRRRFRELTMGHSVLMGRKTYESISGSLSGRRCMVLSLQAGFRAEGCEVVTSIAHALELCSDTEELFVAGGEELYRQALPLAQKLYISHVELSPEGDAGFPEIPEGEFVELSRETLSLQPGCTLVIYRRKAAGPGAA